MPDIMPLCIPLPPQGQLSSAGLLGHGQVMPVIGFVEPDPCIIGGMPLCIPPAALHKTLHT